MLNYSGVLSKKKKVVIVSSVAGQDGEHVSKCVTAAKRLRKANPTLECQMCLCSRLSPKLKTDLVHGALLFEITRWNWDSLHESGHMRLSYAS